MVARDNLVTLKGTGGSTLTNRFNLERGERDLARKRRRQTPNLNVAGGAIESLFGLGAASLTGNDQVVRGQSAADAAARFGGDITQTLNQDEKATLEQFFNPRLSQEQRFGLDKTAALASGQGIMGNAVGSQLRDRATTLLAGNRASTFGTVQGLVGRGVSALQQNVLPFLAQFGGLSGLERRRFGGVRETLLAQGQNAQEFSKFVSPALRALNALGLGGDALSGLASSRNISFQGRGGSQGNTGIAEAFSDFANPIGTGVEQFVRHQAFRDERARSGARNTPNAFQDRELGFRAANRIGGGERLAGTIRDQASQAISGAASLSATGEGARAFNQFAQLGDLGSAQEVLGIDTQQFSPLLRSLGITPRSQGQLGPIGRGNILPQSSILRNVIGI